MKKLFHTLPLLLTLLFAGGCCHRNARFERLFCWGIPTDETTARKYAEIGVTDIRVTSPKQYALAVRYGMTPYCGTFTPAGPHLQVLSPAEDEYHRYINGHDLDRKKMGKAAFMQTVTRRRKEKQHQYGETSANGGIDTLPTAGIPCFNSDTGFALSKAKIDRILAKAQPGVKGIFFDYLGYTNHHGCYCRKCSQDYHAYLRKNALPDTQENRNIFYRDLLVNYYNTMIAYVRSKRPEFKTVVHIYPVFEPEPLYGSRIKADFCGETVAWYFPWKLSKVAAYTRSVIRHDHGVPFVGLNSNPASALAYKSPAVLEKELQTILAAGGRSLQVCSGKDMIKPGYYEVFKKYCSKGR